MVTSTARREFTTDLAKSYSVTVWGSNPDETDNDDCWTGDDFDTNEQACAAFMATVGDRTGMGAGSVSRGDDFAFVMIDGPDVHLVAKNPRYSEKRARREAREADAEWQSERAHQAGMAFGCDGYNDEMAY